MNWILTKLALTALFTIADGVLYYLGGTEGYHRWYRTVAVGVLVMATLWLWFGFDWSILLAGGASAGLSTTYFKAKGTDAKWYNWLFVGLAMGIAILPWVYFQHSILVWIGFALRTFVLGLTICLWSEFVSNARIEQGGRGGLIIATIPLIWLPFWIAVLTNN